MKFLLATLHSRYSHKREPSLPHPEIARRLGMPRTSSFRTFSLKFSRNYAAIPWQDEETVITFVYLNGRAGGRARVLAFEPE